MDLFLLTVCIFCSGTTALVAVVRGMELAVANVGDSRGVLYDQDEKTIPLSFDHKPHEVYILPH